MPDPHRRRHREGLCLDKCTSHQMWPSQGQRLCCLRPLLRGQLYSRISLLFAVLHPRPYSLDPPRLPFPALPCPPLHQATPVIRRCRAADIEPYA